MRTIDKPALKSLRMVNYGHNKESEIETGEKNLERVIINARCVHTGIAFSGIRI